MLLALFPTPGWATDAVKFMRTDQSGPFLVMSFKFNQVMTPKKIEDTVKDAANNPWVRATIAKAVEAYTGVPAQWTEVSLKIAAAQIGGGTSEERSYRVPYPSGWQFCRAKVQVISVTPYEGKRGSIFNAGAQLDRLDLSAWTPKQGMGGGRSWVDADVSVILVKTGDRAKLVKDGTCKAPGGIVGCRGDGKSDRNRTACGTHEL